MSRIIRILILVYLPVALLAGNNEDMARYLQGEAAFTPNQGQLCNMDGKPANNVLAYYNTPGLQVYLTTKGITYVMQQFEVDSNAKPHPVYINEKKSVIHYSRVDVDLDSAQINIAQFEFADEEGWKSNYYKSADGKGQLGVKHYKMLTIKNIYPAIDWVWKCDANKKLEYNFVVHAGADAGAIKMHYKYADLTPDANKLLITAKYGTLAEGPLLASSMGEEVKIQYRYSKADKTIRFEAGDYKHSRDLEIDPPLALQWSAQYGGSFNSGLRGVTTDIHGLIYTVGYTNSPDFPTFQSDSSYIDSTYNGGSDAVILKIDTDQHLLWSTFFGGPGNDYANSVAFDSSTGNIYVVGSAGQGFPLVILNGALNRTYFGSQDAFISLFNANLQLKWSTYFGDYQTDEALKISIDSRAHNLFVTGYTQGGGSFPVVVVNNGYNQGGVAGGYDAFMLKFYSPAPNLCSLQWATFFGGAGDDYGTGLAIDSMHNVFLTGYTHSTNLPLVNSNGYYQATNAGGYDGFIAKFGGNINNLSSSTYFGGTGDDYFTGITSRLDGSVMLTGYTTSTNYPLLNSGPSYFQDSLAGGTDAVITQFANNLSLFWSTYYGGTDNDVGTGVATDKNGRLYVTGFTFSNNFPLQQASFPGSYYQPVNHGLSDGFLAGFGTLGQRFWSTYKGDTCYEYPNDIAYDTTYNKFYVAGENLLNCEGLPDTNQVNSSGSSSVGFCWSFVGPGIPTCSVSLVDAKTPCPYTCNGSEVAHLLNATPPYTFLWSDNETSDTASNLCDGVGWVEVTDSTGCVSDAAFVLVPLSLTTGSAPNFCGGGNGKTWANANGGTPPYTYLWTGNNSTRDTLARLAAGVYTVQVRDAAGCVVTDSDAVIDSSYTVAALNYWDNCDGGIYGSPDGLNFGSSSIVISGATALPLIIQWSTGLSQVVNQGDTQINAIHFPAGNYSVTVTDTNGCTYTNSFTISLLHWQDLFITAPCNTNDSIFLNYNYNAVETNTEIYSYSPPLAENLSSFLTQGQIYAGNGNSPYDDVYVQWYDSYGDYCYVDTTLSIPAPIGFSDMLFNPLPDITNCGNNQSLAVRITQEYAGYTASPFTYHWSDGETGDTIRNLPPGAYSCTVTSNGCTAAAADTVIAPSIGAPLITDSLIYQKCGSANDGSIALTVIGAGGYSYNWSNNMHTAIDTGLAPGVYSCTITDVNGCTAVSTDTLKVPTAPIITDSLIRKSCGGGSDGSITLTLTGAGDYSYSWSNLEYAAIDTSLAPGVYSCTITDINGCTVASTDTIGVLPPLVIYESSQNPECYGDSTGQILITPTGGAGNYTYQWSNGVQTPDNNQLAAGIYYGTVTDQNGCTTKLDSIIIIQPPQIIIIDSTINPSCFNSTNGSILLDVSGGTGLYAYHWSNNVSDSINQPLSAGNYTCTITDANGCSVAKQFNIASPDSLIAFLGVQSTLCGSANGTVKLDSVYGGTAPYVLHWSTGSSIDSITNLSAGNYPLTITDNNGCVYTFSDSVPCVTGIDNIVEDNLLAVYPNPASTIVYINSAQKQDYRYLLRDIAGQIVIKQNFTQSLLLDISDLSRGVYMVEIYDRNSHILAVKKLVLQ
jgi:Secretion system C-terminal sorting domain/SprB repeat/Beta-propeller repeat